MDWSVLTSPDTLVTAGWGGGLALAIVAAFMVIWRIRSPREEARPAASPPAHAPFKPASSDAATVAAHNGDAAHLEDGHMAAGTFATVVNCIDGRAQGPVSDWIKINCQASFVDTITTPGPDKLLSSGPHSKVEHVREAVAVSVNAHKSRAVVIAGHYDCAANPASADEHKRQILAAAEVVRSWGLPVRIAGLWVNEWWQVEVVLDEPAGVAS
jgi:carbonic anhydrase-like protein